MDKEDALRLAEASQTGLKSRIEVYTRSNLPENPFKLDSLHQFFLGLTIPENPDLGLVTPPCLTHDRFEALAKKFRQSYSYKSGGEVRQFDIYPRGLILSSMIEEDCEDYRNKNTLQNINRRARREAVRINKRIRSVLNKVASLMYTENNLDPNIFSSELEYYHLLTDPSSKSIITAMLQLRNAGQTYFPVFRCNYSRSNCQDGGFLDRTKSNLIENRKTLLVILPEASQETLEPIVKREMQKLGLA